MSTTIKLLSMQPKLRLLLVTLSVIFFSFVSITSRAQHLENSGPVIVASDYTDYPPLSTATFTGKGFMPYEPIVLKVKNLNQPCNTSSNDSSYVPWTISADSEGNFVSVWIVCNCANDSLRLKVVGQTSGYIAYLYFKDDPSTGDYRTVANNNWTQNNTWERFDGTNWVATNVFPGQGTGTGNVLIRHNIILNATPANAIGSLTIGDATSGSLTFGSNNTDVSLSVSGDIVINSGSIINTAGNGGNVLNIGGNFSNAGTFDFNIGTATANVVFNKNGNQTISGNGSFDFNTITLNMGTTNSNVLDVQSIITMPSGGLILTNGTFKLSSASSILQTTLSIPTTAGFWNNGGTVNGGNGSWTVNGLFRNSAGTTNIGNSDGNSLLYGNNSSSFIIEGGAVNIAGRLSRDATDGRTTTYNQSGGVVTVVTSGSTSATRAGFDIGAVGSSFTMSGGSIVIQKATSNASDYLNLANTNNITGGTLQIGNASTPTIQTIKINSTTPVYNLIINTPSGSLGRLQSNLTVLNDVTISGSGLDGNNFSMTVGGNWSNSGSATAPTTVTFNKSTGTQTVGSSGSGFNNLVHGGAGTLRLNNSLVVNNDLTNTTGTLDAATNNADIFLTGNWSNSGTFSAGNATVWFNASSGTQTLNGGASSFNNLVHNGTGILKLITNDLAVLGNITNSAGELNANGLNISIGGHWLNSATFTAGIGTVTFNGNSGQIIGGSSVTSFNNIVIDNLNGISLGIDASVGGTTNALTFSNGKISTAANKLILASGATISGAGTGKYINGNLRRFIPSTNNFSADFPIGDANNYTPALIDFVGTPSGSGYLDASTSAIAPTAGAQPSGAGLSASKYVKRRWVMTHGGVTGFTSYSPTFTFVAGDIQGSADPTKFIISKLNSGTWSTTTIGAKTSTTTQATGLTSFSEFTIGEPLNTAPSVTDVPKSVNEDNTLAFTSTDFTSHFTDPESNSLAKIKILSLPSNGTLKIGASNAAVNDEVSFANLGTISFVPNNNYNGSTSFSWNGSDGSLYAETPVNVSITVNSVNDAPSGADKTITTNEDVDYTFIASDFGFTDGSDNPANTIAAVKLTTLPSTGSLTLNGSTITLAGTVVSVTDINASNLKFRPVANGNGSSYTSFTFQVKDNGGTANSGLDLDPSAKTMTVNVTAVNDAPTVTDISKSGSEDVTINFAASDFTAHYSDVENTPLAKVKITSLPLHGTLQLSGVDVVLNQEIFAANLGNLTLVPDNNYNGSITFKWNGSDGTAYAVSDGNVNISLTAVNDAPTVANAVDDVTVNEDDANTVIDLSNTFTDVDGDGLTITVDNNSNSTLVTASYNPGTKQLTLHYNTNQHGSATITLQASDGNLFVQDQFDITVNSVNDAPAGTDKSIAILEDQPYTFTVSDFGFTDPNDNPANSLLSVKITTLATAGTLKLNGTSVSAGDFILVTDIAAGNLKFYPTSNAFGTPYATFTFQVRDNGGTVNGGVDLDASANTITINVTSVNDAPSGGDKTVTTLEDNDYTFSTSDFGFTDVDGNSLLAVKITTLPGAGAITKNGIVVTAGQFISVSDINGNKLKFSPAANANGTNYAHFTFQVQDDGGTDNGGNDLDGAANTITIDVTPVNDAPTLSDVSKLGTEDVTMTFAASDFTANFSDIDGDLLNTIKITSLPLHGTLKLSGSNVAIDQEISTANIGNLTFVPDLNYNGNTSFGWNGSDGTAYAVSGASVNMTLAAVNDAPTVANAIGDVTVNEDAANTVISLTNTFADVDGDGLTITVNNNSNSALVTASYNAGTKELTLHYNANKNGTATITIRASDGYLYADDQFDVTVRSVNDAPVGSNKTVNINEDNSYTFSAADFGFTDPDDNPANTLLAVKITSIPSSGILKLTGTNVSAGDFIPAASIGNLVYTPASNANGSPYTTFTFQVQDNGGTAYTGVDLDQTSRTVTINVAPVNDAPIFTKGGDQTVLEDAGAQTVSNWATGIDDGDAEVTQTVTFVVTGNTNTSLFSVAPSVDASGKLTYTPAANANGSATITIKLTDNGGTTNGGIDYSAEQTFVINVTAVNDAPSFTKGADQTANEDVGAQTVTGWATALSKGGGADEASQVLSFVVTGNTTTALFSVAPAVSSNGTLTYTLAANAHGTATITIKLTDNGGTDNGGVNESAEQTFVITVRSVNDAPTGTDNTITILEDNTYTFNTTDFGFGDANDAPANNFYAVKITTLPSATAGALKNNGVAVSAGSFVLTSDIALGKFKFYPAANANGSPLGSFSFQVQDDGGTAYSGVDLDASANTITFNATAVNDVPVFTKGADQTVLEDVGAQTVSGWATGINDGDPEVAQTLTFNVTNNNNSLFSVQPSINSTTGTLTFTPAPNANGTATVTVTLKDNGGIANGGVDESAEQTFTITITAVNDVPVFTKGGDQTNLEDAGAVTVNDWATGISAGPADEVAQALTFHVSNNNPTLFSVQPAIDASGNLTYTLAANKNGTATVTVYLTDNGGIANGGDDRSDDQTFTITVTSVNDAPAGADKTISINEDAAYTFAATDFGFTDPNDNPANTLSAVKITTLPSAGTLSNNGSPLSAGAFISLADINAGKLVFTPATNANGGPYATFTFQVQDNGGTSNYGVNLDPVSNTITFNVTPVNDAPVFTKGVDQTVLEDAGAQTVSNWATGIDDGDADATQTVSFIVTGNTNTALFSVQPSVSSTGVLTYTPAANANGTATIKIKLTDNGGTANGGIDYSAEQTFAINVTAVNDAPSFIVGADQTVNEDAGPQSVSTWATSINDGDPETSQALTFVITGNTNTALFSTQPAVSSTGTLTYTPAANANGAATIKVKITDDGGTSNGGINESAEQTFIITIRSVNDAPSGTDKTVTTLEDNVYTFSVSDFGFADVNDNPQNNFSAVKITTVPSNGTLKNGATTLVAGNTVLVTDINAGNLKFYPVANANGDPYTSFTFQVKDDGGTAYSGIDMDQSPNTITIKVKPVNDAPSFVKGVDKTVAEDAGPQTFANWASSISKGGGTDESGQALTFIVTGNTNPGLFSAAPAISSTGVLTFTSALNANGTATITVKLTDNGGTADGGINESAEQTFVITITAVNDAPVTNVSPAGAQTVQYSDPVTAVTLTATDVDNINSQLTASTSYNFNGGAFGDGLPTGLALAEVTGSNPKAWTLAGKMMVVPGTYVVRLTVSDGALTDSKDITITVNPEDARAYYTGAFFASTSSTSTTTANVQLAATIKDITAVDGVVDPNGGDIRNARVTFKILETGQTFSNLVPVLVDPSDTKTGIVTYNWVADIGASDSKQFTVEIRVDNYYTRNSPEDDAVITVSKPFNDFITGGGYIVLSNSIGTKAGDVGSKNNFGFNVKFNKSGTNLQGNINTIIRRKESDGVHVYQVKGNSMTSLSTNIAQGPGKAVFNGKASIQDITNPLNVLPVDGGASLQVTMTDMGEPGSSDRIGITVWTKTGALWFASSWDGTRTIEQQIAGGNLKVNSSSAPVTGTNPTQTTVISNLSPLLSGQSVTFTATITETPVYALANPTGVVTFLDGSTVIGTTTLNGGVATFTTTSLAPGTHEISAYYSGDSKFMMSSGKVSQVVNTIASSANPRLLEITGTIDASVFAVTTYPNPATSQFNVKLESSNKKDDISIIVYSTSGKVVETKQHLSAGQTIQLGALYRPGFYILEMIQGNQHKQLKLVKIPN